MKYTEKACKEILKLISIVNNYFSEEKQIIITDMIVLENFLKIPVGNNISGKLILKFYSQNQLENGTVVQLSETIQFDKNGFTIKSFSQEGYFGEYYTNNEFRIDVDEPEEFLPQYVNDTLNEIFLILNEKNGKLELTTNRFQVKQITYIKLE